MEEPIECAICLEEITKFAVPFSSNLLMGEKNCKHNFCPICLSHYLKKKLDKKEIPKCPMCNEEFDGFLINRMADELFDKSKKFFSKSQVLRVENEELEKIINSLKEQKDQEVLELSKQVKKMSKDSSNLGVDNQNMRNRIEELERDNQENTTIRLKELESYQSKIDIQQQQILKLSQNNHELKENMSRFQEIYEQNKQLQQMIMESENKNKENHSKIQSQEQFIQGMSQKSQRLSNTLHGKQEELDMLNNELEKQKNTYALHIHSNEKYIKKIQDLESAVSAYIVELSNAKTHSSQLQQKNRTLEKEIEELNLVAAKSYNSSLLTTDSLVNNVSKLATSITSGVSYLRGATSLSSSQSNSSSAFLIPWKEVSVFEKRNSSKSSEVKRVTIKHYQYIIKKVSYQPPKGLYSYYSSAMTEADMGLFRETMILYKLSHINILKVEALTRDDSNSTIYNVISPFAPMDLEYVIAESIKSQRLSIAKIKYIVYQIICGVHYLHSQELVHRDLRPTSILVYDDEQVKIGSFGLCQSVFTNYQNTITFPQYPTSSSYYLSPEFLQHTINPNDNSSSGNPNSFDWKAFDMWSIGCILLELLYQKKLFTTSSFNASQNVKISNCYKDYLNLLCSIVSYKECTLSNNTNSYQSISAAGQNISITPTKNFKSELSQFSEFLSEELYQLLCLLLCFDPQKRIKAEQAAQHSIFRNESYYIKDFNDPLSSLPKYRDIASTLTDRNIKEFLKEKCFGLVQV